MPNTAWTVQSEPSDSFAATGKPIGLLLALTHSIDEISTTWTTSDSVSTTWTTVSEPTTSFS